MQAASAQVRYVLSFWLAWMMDMRVTLKLYATLGDLLPKGANQNSIRINVAHNATPNQVIDQYKVSREMAHLVLLNGVYVGKEDRDKPLIKENDALAIWPPIAGG
jgi:molybdopterin synthase sulfur carrier subunit